MAICKELGCKTSASFGHEGGKKEYCAKHKEKNMINVKSKRCKEENCKISASFGYEGGKRVCCGKHKEKNMINLTTNSKCKKTNCQITASFGYEGGKKEFCVKHKKKNMINLVKKCICKEENCKTTASYGYEDGKKEFCSKHKKKNMITLINACKQPGCETQSSYGYKDGQKMYCLKHKQEDMIDLIHKKCINDYCSTKINPIYKPYCGYCFHNLFPDDPKSKNYMTKEKNVTKFIMDAYRESGIFMNFNKEIKEGCSTRRPDIAINMGSHVIIVEIDENQHKSSSYTTCDSKRTCEIYKAYKQPIVFIRFNPDAYKDENGCRIPSCWKPTRNGMTIVNKKKWNKRLSALKDKIDYWMEHEPKKEITYRFLFYDK